MVNKALALSIIIPAYNEEHHLRRCLEAIAVQSVAPDEVIVVDNNSADQTQEIAKSFSFVTVISEKHQGLYFSRQAGINAATGDIICRIDADTCVDLNWVKEIKQAFLDPKVKAITGPVGYHDMPFPKVSQKTEDVFLRIARKGRYDFLMGANMAIRRTAWELIKDELCNEPFLFEDIDIAIHLGQAGIYPTYVPAMKAQVSSRRFEDKPSDFLRYIGGHTRTLEHHSLETPAGVHLAESAFVLVYFGIKPLHMSFDPQLRRPSIKYLFKHRTPRPDPMAAV